jgi:hypothetical protein
MRERGILERVTALVEQGDVLISAHGYDELADDGIQSRDALAGLAAAEVIEEYPEAAKGPCVLVLEWDDTGSPFHVVWGIPKGLERPAVLITAYRPDPGRCVWALLLRRRC